MKKISFVFIIVATLFATNISAEPAEGLGPLTINWGAVAFAKVQGIVGTYTRNADFKNEFLKGFKFGDTRAWLSMNWKDTLGFRLRLNFPDDIASNTTLNVYSLFNETYLWLDSKYFYTEVGMIENRKASRLDQVIDKVKFGYFNPEGTLKTTDIGGMNVETDLLNNWILSAKLPVPVCPIRIDIAPVSGTVDALIASIDRNRTSGMQWTNSFNIGGRISTGIENIFTTNATYSLAYNMKDEFIQGDESDGSEPQDNKYVHKYGVYGELLVLNDLRLVLGYSGGVQINSKVNKIEPKPSKVFSNIYDAIELRASYLGVPKFSFHTQHKLSFGRNIGDGYIDTSSMQQKINEQTSFMYWGALGIAYNPTDAWKIGLVGWYANLEFDNKLANKMVHEMQVGVEPEVTYYFAKDVWIKGQVSMVMTASDKNMAATSKDMWDELDIKVSFPISINIGISR